ncbi:MAG: nucleoside deaminase [Candidatus Rokubacteria bacterium]|nr:nucleoside deaminase [Candidatus Rokubacteria bacterium]MBI2878605.1 nucleoside deaminase [Candidatus Rokubacteria bacterium]
MAQHEGFLRAAIAEAQAGAAEGNFPVGSVVVRDGAIVARGHNEVVTASDPTAHAEMVALRRAGAALGTPLLAGCTLYTTLEPCPMCAAALSWARIDRLVIGALFPPTGGVRSQARVLELMAPLVHPVEVVAEVLAEECLALLPPEAR